MSNTRNLADLLDTSGDIKSAALDNVDVSGKLSLSGGAMTGAITTNSTFDGVDIATRDAVLTSTTTTANAALPKAGGTMTGTIAGFTSTGIDDNADATAITIDSSENIGLGTTPPSATSNSSYKQLFVNTGGALVDSGGGGPATMVLNNSYIGSGNNNYATATQKAARIVMTSGRLTFDTAPSVSANAQQTFAERMRITDAGRVGIGTTSPSVNVHIVDDASEGTPTFAGATHLAVQATASSTDNVNIALISGTGGVSRIMFGDKDDEDVGLIQHSNSTGKMSFKVNGVSDVMTIDNYGRILTGTATDTSVNPNGLSVRASSYGLYACKISHSASTGDGAGILIDIENYSASGGITMIRFDTSAGQVGSIKSNQNSTAYNTSSDYRLKENVDYTWDATTRLKQLKPARFNFINDDTNTLVDGFIAHEVSTVVPEAISGEKDAVDSDGNIDPQGIDQSKLVPLLVKTIQELEARITALEA